MIIKENHTNSMIELVGSLNEASTRFNHINLIPVIKSNNNHLVQLEEIVNYSTNHNTDVKDTINELMESNHIDDISLTIREDHAILNNSLVELGKELIQEGMQVSFIPLSDNDPVSKLGKYCLEQAYLTDDYKYWLGTVFMETIDYDTDNWEDGLYKTKGKDDYFDFDELVNKSGKSYKEIVDWLLKSDKVNNYTKKLIKDEIEYFKKGQSESKDEKSLYENLVDHIIPRSQSDKFIQGYDRFYVGNMHDPKFKHALNRQNFRYNVVDKFSRDPAKYMNDKSTRDDEASFNKAKEKTLSRLKFANKHVDKISVEGMDDEKVEHVQERIKKLQDIVEKEKFPKSWLAKKIAWLRSLYRNLMYKTTLHRSTGTLSGVTNKVRQLASFVLRLIDKLAQKLQNAAS